MTWATVAGLAVVAIPAALLIAYAIRRITEPTMYLDTEDEEISLTHRNGDGV